MDLKICLFRSALEKINKVIISRLLKALTQKVSWSSYLEVSSSTHASLGLGGDDDGDLLLCYVYECECFVCTYVCSPSVCLVLEDARRGYQIPRTGVIDYCRHVGPGSQFQAICCSLGQGKWLGARSNESWVADMNTAKYWAWPEEAVEEQRVLLSRAQRRPWLLRWALQALVLIFEAEPRRPAGYSSKKNCSAKSVLLKDGHRLRSNSRDCREWGPLCRVRAVAMGWSIVGVKPRALVAQSRWRSDADVSQQGRRWRQRPS